MKCNKCNSEDYTPVHVTSLIDGKIEVSHMCEKCGTDYICSFYPKSSEKVEEMHQTIDLNKIDSPEKLLDFIMSLGHEEKPCLCGMTEKEFEEIGRFGCQHCYFHFSKSVNELVVPFHQANYHYGKKPKKHYIEKMMQNPAEKIKILKLKYAKALELENYEQAKMIKEELDKNQ